MPTSEAVSASVGLARQAVREAEELIDTIMVVVRPACPFTNHVPSVAREYR